MNGLSNPAIRVHQVLQMPRHESLRMAASSGTGERTTGVARIAQLADGGYAQ